VHEGKGVDANLLKELARLIVLTNHDNVVEMDDIRQRRVIYMEMDNCKGGDDEYHMAFHAHCSTPEFRRHWLAYLMSRDLTGWNRKSANLPQTELMLEHYANSRPVMGEWFVERFCRSSTPTRALLLDLGRL
jgi:hypothetical protein